MMCQALCQEFKDEYDTFSTFDWLSVYWGCQPGKEMTVIQSWGSVSVGKR